MFTLSRTDAGRLPDDVTQDVIKQTIAFITDQPNFPAAEQTSFSAAQQTNLSIDQGNSTADPETGGLEYPLWAVILIVICCTIIMAGTVVGNLLVCTAVSIVRKLRTPSNWLIVSLAVADLLVALLVMPLAVMYEVKGEWLLGPTVCDMWTALDVMLCTASILNLCMISVDRYFVISRPFSYGAKRTPLKMTGMIVSVWLLAALISIPPIFGWKSESSKNQCLLSQEIGYQIYATLGAFYLPLIVMIIIYYRIYALSARIQRSDARSKPSSSSSSDYSANRKASMPYSASKNSMDYNHGSSSAHNRLDVVEMNRQHSDPFGGSQSSRQNSIDTTPLKSAIKRNLSFLHRSGLHRVSASKERKATKTLGIIMGAFTACWLPFFIVALIRPFLADKSVIPDWFFSLLQWLGFANSFFNPIIYARFNRDFRTPFKEILSCHCSEINLRIRSESYTEQYGQGTDGGGSGVGGGLPGGHRGTVISRGHGGSRGGSIPENSVLVTDGFDPEGRPKHSSNNGLNHSSSARRQTRA